jgi:hypothetical protein
VSLEEIAELLLERIAACGVDDIRETARGYRGSCPHCGKDDRFEFGERDDGDGYRIKCHGGCARDDILDVLELTWRDLRLSSRAKERIADLRNPDPATARQVEFVWQGRFPKAKITNLVGNDGVGKRVTVAWAASALTRGLLPGDLYGSPANVLIIGDEDAIEDTWTPRLIAAEADLGRVFFQVQGDIDIDFTDPADVEHLRALIRLKDIEAMFLDAMLDHLGDASTDEYRPKAVRHALRPLRRLAADEDIAVIGALHPRKGRVGTFRDLVANSHQFRAVSRSSLLLAPHPDDKEMRILALGKANYAGLVSSLEFRIEVCDFEIDGKAFRNVRAVDWEETEISIEEAVNTSTGMPGRPGHGEKRDRVLAALTDEPQSMRALAKATGIPRSTTYDILFELEDEGAVKTKDGWMAENPPKASGNSRERTADTKRSSFAEEESGSSKPNLDPDDSEASVSAVLRVDIPDASANGEIDDRESLLEDLEELGQ